MEMKYLEMYEEGENYFCGKACEMIEQMKKDGADKTEIAQALEDFNEDGSCFKNNYIFHYKGETNVDPFSRSGRDLSGKWVEYDGTIVNAPNEDEAWEIFLHMAGEFGCPDEDDYTCDLLETK